MCGCLVQLAHQCLSGGASVGRQDDDNDDGGGRQGVICIMVRQLVREASATMMPVGNAFPVGGIVFPFSIVFQG